jgi:farnesyl diphosphate synthase
MKTGALVSAAARIGAISGESVSDEVLEKVGRYGDAIGLAYQITDDILDHTGDSSTLGKPEGSDSRMNKSTYVTCVGLDTARIEARKLSSQAIESIQGLGDNKAFLEQLARFVVDRGY